MDSKDDIRIKNALRDAYGKLAAKLNDPSMAATESAVANDLRLAAQIRNLALEEAAAICDNYARNYEGWAGGNDVAEGLAEAIRAAKQ